MIKVSDIKVGAKFIGNLNRTTFEVVEVKHSKFCVFSPRIIVKDVSSGIIIPCGLKSFAMCNFSLIAG